MVKKTIVLPILLCLCISFSFMSMGKTIEGEFVRDTPLNEETLSGYNWTWLNDKSCVRFSGTENASKSDIARMYNMGMLPQWANDGSDGVGIIQERTIYAGKWSQSPEGIWSFVFDDKTIPVGVTKIDDVLYAFNGFGELKEGYEYYEGLKTGADGLVTSDDPAFLEWLATQYVPSCTSHE